MKQFFSHIGMEPLLPGYLPVLWRVYSVDDGDDDGGHDDDANEYDDNDVHWLCQVRALITSF